MKQVISTLFDNRRGSRWTARCILMLAAIAAAAAPIAVHATLSYYHGIYRVNVGEGESPNTWYGQYSVGTGQAHDYPLADILHRGRNPEYMTSDLVVRSYTSGTDYYSDYHKDLTDEPG